MPPYKSIFGQELQLMLEGRKPMSVFYRATCERFDETGGQAFNEAVSDGKVNRTVFYISPPHVHYRVKFVAFTLPGEEWRAALYKELKKAGQKQWNAEMEKLESTLLGYAV